MSADLVTNEITESTSLVAGVTDDSAGLEFTQIVPLSKNTDDRSTTECDSADLSAEVKQEILPVVKQEPDDGPACLLSPNMEHDTNNTAECDQVDEMQSHIQPVVLETLNVARCVRRVDVTGDELEVILRADGTAERDDFSNIIFVTPGGLYVPLEESSILRLTGRTLAQHTGGNEAGAGPAESSQVVAEVDMKSSTEGRWTHAAVLCLIETRKALEVKFGSARYKKKDVWKEVAAKINATCGLQFSSSQVETKWKNITKRYRDIVDHNRISGNERKSCPYFDELDEWYGHKSGVKPSTTASAGTASAATSTTSAADGSPAAECSSSTAPATVNTPTAATPRTSASEISPRKRKRSSMQTHMDYCLNNVLTAVKEMADNMQKMEQERLQLARQMHAEKMKFFGDFLEVLKGEKPDKQ